MNDPRGTRPAPARALAVTSTLVTLVAMLAGSGALFGSTRAALAEAPGGAPASAAPTTPTPVRASADTAFKIGYGPGMFSRVMAAADSAVRARGGARADDAQLYLTWNAPWGSARARQVRMPACTDSTVEDTLYMSFLAGRKANWFTGFTATLYFRATGTDTLGAWWHMEPKNAENTGGMRVEVSSAQGFPGVSPWGGDAQGGTYLDHTSTVVRLRLVFAVPWDGAGPIAPEPIYSLARIILRHRPARGLAGCEKPVCVEWAVASLAFGPKDEPTVRRGERYVGYGGAAGLCEPFKGPPVKAWRPKFPGAK